MGRLDLLLQDLKQVEMLHFVSNSTSPNINNKLILLSSYFFKLNLDSEIEETAMNQINAPVVIYLVQRNRHNLRLLKTPRHIEKKPML